MHLDRVALDLLLMQDQGAVTTELTFDDLGGMLTLDLLNLTLPDFPLDDHCSLLPLKRRLYRLPNLLDLIQVNLHLQHLSLLLLHHSCFV